MKEIDRKLVGEYIQGYVQEHIADWIRKSNAEAFYSTKIGYDYEISLTERIVRVEEAIKHQGDLIEKVLHQMDKRFEQVDKRFKQMFAYFTTAFSIFGAVLALYPVFYWLMR